MASSSDAELILRLYELRRESTMRKARSFIIFEFQPKTLDDLMGVQRGLGTEQNAYWRQVLSYWEMAASFVLRGALDPDLFFDSNGEGIFIYAKFRQFHAGYEKETNHAFMKYTAKLVEQYPVARARYDTLVKMFAAREAAARK